MTFECIDGYFCGRCGRSIEVCPEDGICMPPKTFLDVYWEVVISTLQEASKLDDSKDDRPFTFNKETIAKAAKAVEEYCQDSALRTRLTYRY